MKIIIIIFLKLHKNTVESSITRAGERRNCDSVTKGENRKQEYEEFTSEEYLN